MGIVLLTIGLLAVSIVLSVLANKKWWDSEVLFVVASFVLGVALLGEILAIAIIQGVFENEYNQKLYQKQALEYRLEIGELQGNEFLYHDITEFNNELRSVKYWYNNPWTNWFNNGKVASIDYIEIGA